MISLRAARLDDCERVWEWNFAADVRARSKSHATVTLADHARWYAARIASGSPMWIVEDAGRPVGVIRLDPTLGFCRVSIALAAEARGRGIGRRAIELACRQARNVVVAEILADNVPSRKCFESCGFVETDSRGDLVTYRYEGKHDDANRTARSLAQ